MVMNRRQILTTAAASLAVSASMGPASADNPMPTELREAIERQPFAPVLGNLQGDITLTEFFDYNCPVCKTLPPLFQKLLASDPNLRIVLREWPVIRPESESVAKISLATLKQGKYWQFHHAMMAHKGRADEASALAVAEAAGLDMAKLKRDRDGKDIMSHIYHSMDLGDHMMLAGTPSFIAGNSGAFGRQSLSDLQALVKQARIDLS